MVTNPALQTVVTTSSTELVLVDHPPIDQNPAAVYLASLSQSGRRTQQHALNTIANMLTGGAAPAFTCPWSEVRYQHTAALRTKLAERYSVAMVNKVLSALRRVLKESWKLGYMSAEDYQRAASVESIRGETLPTGRELSSGELVALMNACQEDPGPAGVRDAAMIAILYSWGLRRAEIVTLDIADYDSDKGELVVKV